MSEQQAWDLFWGLVSAALGALVLWQVHQTGKEIRGTK